MYQRTARTAGQNEQNGQSGQSEKQAPIELLIRPRGVPLNRHLPEKTYALPTDTCDQLYLRIAAKTRVTVHRFRITKNSDGSLIPNDDKRTVDDLGLYEGNTLLVKDLGPQVAWRTVFLVEYVGPLLIHPLIFFLRQKLYPSAATFYAPASTAQIISFSLIFLHFLKRELETIFVHRFSGPTMPIFNIFKNSAHYWLIAGLNIAVFTYSPSPSCPTARPAPFFGWNFLAVLLFLVGEVGNLATHLQLRGLRSQGGKERGIPRGGVYDLVPVTCPNYFFETVAWIGIWMSNRSLSTLAFLIPALYQMAVWAKKKERRYRSEFGEKYGRKRYSMIPYVV